MAPIDLTHLLQKLDYDPHSGIFTWRSKGKQAGCFSKGHVLIRLDDQLCRGEHLAYLIIHGRLAEKEICFKDGDTANLAALNLFEFEDTSSPITQEYLLQLLDYDPIQGTLLWRKRIGQSRADRIFNGNFAFQPAGCLSSQFKWTVRIDGHLYPAIYLIWIMLTGEFASERLWLKDGNGENLKAENIGVYSERPEILTKERLREVLDYNPTSGQFHWNAAQQPRDNSGRYNVVGSLDNTGYLSIGIDGQRYLAHRLAWLYMTGYFPPNDIDHISTNKLDNRWCNLREATRTENMRNKGKTKANRSGYKGVSWHKAMNQYRATIKADGKPICLGHFDNPKAAHEAYCKASAELHLQFGRTE
jgi:hypothetical protein